MKATTWQTLTWRDETLLHHKLEWLVPRCRNQGTIQLIAPLSSLNPPLTNQGVIQAGKHHVQEASGGQGNYFHLKASQRSWVVRWRQEERALGYSLSRHHWNRNFTSFHALPQNDVYLLLQETPCRRLSQWIFLFIDGISPELFVGFPRISCVSYTEHKMDRRGVRI